MNENLSLAQKKQDELLKVIEESPEIQAQRPVFHFATFGGWCNDPNGFSQFKNTVHLFFSIILIQQNGDRCIGDM